jgi:WD40 repeat protein
MLCRCAPWVLVLAMVAAGCGGGGGGGGDDDDGGGGDDGPPAGDGDDGGGDDGSDGGDGGTLPSDVNGELRGTLYFNAPYDYVELDLSSGITTVVRNRREDFVSEASPSSDGSEFVATDDPLRGELGDVALLLLDRDGTTVSGVDFPPSLTLPKLSDDGSRIAVLVDFIPTVLDREAQTLAEFPQLVDATDLEWAPDGRLLIAVGDAVHVVDAELGGAEVLVRFEGDAPHHLAVSPDGSQLALALFSTDDNPHVFVMNMDGSGLRQLTTSDGSEDGAAWSPDGSWIIVRHDAGLPLSCPLGFAVPSDGNMIEVSDEATGDAVRLQKIEDGELSGVCAFSPPEWRAALEPLPSSPGTPPDGAGINAGLPGRLVFEGVLGGDDNGFVELAVEDGSPRLLPLGPDIDPTFASDPYVARDGQELVYQYLDLANSALTEITFQDIDGPVTGSFQQPEGFSGQPKVSPDGALVAIEWHSIDIGDDPSVPIVTVFDRNGAIQVRWGEADDWDWLPDGRLLLADRNDIAVTNETLDEITEVASLTDDIEDLELSPDGTRLAFAMNGHIWTMGVDGSGLRRVTRAPVEVSAPTWSPDGRYLAVILELVCPVVAVVPADGERVSVGDPVVPTSSRLLKEIENGEPRNVCAFSAMSWR